MAQLPLSPFILYPDHRFVLDEAAFMAAIEPSPAFLASPRREYLRAIEIMPIVETIGPYAKPGEFTDQSTGETSDDEAVRTPGPFPKYGVGRA